MTRDEQIRWLLVANQMREVAEELEKPAKQLRALVDETIVPMVLGDEE